MITFHKILAGCAAGDYASWQAFATEYTPLAFHLCDVYLQGARTGRDEFWRDALQTLAAGNFERLRGFGQQEEREFLVELRQFLLERGAAGLDAEHDSTAPRPTTESVAALVEGLPLLHQEILFLKLAGYSNRTLERMLRITAAVVEKGLERLRSGDGAALGLDSDAAQWPAAWLDLVRHAWAANTEACPPLRRFIRIQDGQVSWYDKEPVEQHTTRCLSCLERSTSLAEVAHWRREAPRCPASEIEPLLCGLPLKEPVREKASLLKRMFG